MARMKNKNKAIHNLDRKKHAWTIDPEDPFFTRRMEAYNCRLCGSPSEPYTTDIYGDLIVSCTNWHCPNSKDYTKRLDPVDTKLIREMMLHSRYMTDYLGGYNGEFYNINRKYAYKQKPDLHFI